MPRRAHPAWRSPLRFLRQRPRHWPRLLIAVPGGAASVCRPSFHAHRPQSRGHAIDDHCAILVTYNRILRAAAVHHCIIVAYGRPPGMRRHAPVRAIEFTPRGWSTVVFVLNVLLLLGLQRSILEKPQGAA